MWIKVVDHFGLIGRFNGHILYSNMVSAGEVTLLDYDKTG